MSSIYSLPVPTFEQQQGARTAPSQSVKRKRKRYEARAEQDESSIHDPGQDEANEEYSAVLSPGERSQRRLARYSLLEPLPPPPFPHKDTTATKPRSKSRASDDRLDNAHGHEVVSLRVQHIANMTAVLHRSVQNKDWARARRALGLLLRTEISGQSLDIRAGDLWGIGAEILFRQRPEQGKTFSRAGLHDATEYYEKLAVRYPYHRTSPDSTNAVDFYLAMFSLWIYVVHTEHVASTYGEIDNAQREGDHGSVARELEEAQEILDRLKRLMTTAPFADNPHFMRLRKDVGLWHADLERDQRLYAPVPHPEDHLAVATERLNI